jgi:biopolymer transport protein TolQ
MTKLAMLAAAPTETVKLDPLSLALASSGVVLVVLVMLLIAAFVVWVIWLLKTLQLRRLQAAQRRFEAVSERAEGAEALVALAIAHKDTPGGRVVIALARRHAQRGAGSELLSAVARRAIAEENQSASSLMPTLSSIASATPFIGLFGTVWGIMNAFIKIGVEKSASLPVVAPAIGEALIATAVGLVAAIPATIAYNYVDKRIGDFLDELSACSDVWSQVLLADNFGTSGPLPLVRESAGRNAAGGE